MKMRRCKRCGDIRPIADFHIVKECLGGRRPVCKFCIRKQQKKSYKANAKIRRVKQRKWHIDNPRASRGSKLKSTYGITIEEYDTMFEIQGGACLICGCPETASRNGKTKNLAVDHNHITGKIRGLLCQKCNQALGLLSENPVVIKSLLEYIIKND